MSFADSARSTTTGAKTKVDYEFILFVSTGGEERLGVSKPTWNLFIENLTDLVMSRVFKDLPVPKIDWSNLVRGIGVPAVVDAVSQALTKQLVGEIEVAACNYTNVRSFLPISLSSFILKALERVWA